jgi:hypothetical protein
LPQIRNGSRPQNDLKENDGAIASDHEFDAEGLAVTPDDFASLALRMCRHQRQYESIADIDRRIRHDLGAARRDIDDEAFNLRHLLVDRDPGWPFVQLTSRFALLLCPAAFEIHDDLPAPDAINPSCPGHGRHTYACFVKLLLRHYLKVDSTAGDRCEGPNDGTF